MLRMMMMHFRRGRLRSDDRRVSIIYKEQTTPGTRQSHMWGISSPQQGAARKRLTSIVFVGGQCHVRDSTRQAAHEPLTTAPHTAPRTYTTLSLTRARAPLVVNSCLVSAPHGPLPLLPPPPLQPMLPWTGRLLAVRAAPQRCRGSPSCSTSPVGGRLWARRRGGAH